MTKEYSENIQEQLKYLRSKIEEVLPQIKFILITTDKEGMFYDLESKMENPEIGSLFEDILVDLRQR